LALDVDGVLRGQGADPAIIRQRSTRLVAAAERALEEALPLLDPVVAYRRLAVESFRHRHLALSGGYSLSGELVAQHLAPAQEVIVLVCTVGKALEEYASRAVATSGVRGLALDGVGSAAAEALATQACLHFEEEAAARGLSVTLPLNPGMIGWSVAEGQSQIFAILDPAVIGVTLSYGHLMLPRKSLSMVLGIGPDVDRVGRTCDYCHMRETCRYQDHYAQNND
jgi:hypothetical protein